MNLMQLLEIYPYIGPEVITKDVLNNKKVKQLKRQIGQLFYKLCDLTPEEIKIVEGALNA